MKPIFMNFWFMNIHEILSVWARNWKRWDTCLAKLKKVRHMSHQAETRLTKLKHMSHQAEKVRDMSHQAEKGDQALATWKEH